MSILNKEIVSASNGYWVGIQLALLSLLFGMLAFSAIGSAVGIFYLAYAPEIYIVLAISGAIILGIACATYSLAKNIKSLQGIGKPVLVSVVVGVCFGIIFNVLDLLPLGFIPIIAYVSGTAVALAYIRR